MEYMSYDYFIYNLNMQEGSNQEIVAEQEDQLDDLPDLFHKSSLRERCDPKLEVFSKETYELSIVQVQNNQTMYNQYLLCQKLGQGAFGAVYKAKSKDNYFALKFCSTLGLEKQRFFAPDGQFANSLNLLENELNIVKRLEHKNITKCFEIIYSAQKIITVNELGNLGQLMIWDGSLQKYHRNKSIVDYISQKYKTDDLGDITRIIFLQVSQAVKYLHDNEITNRDIKVDNIVCTQTQHVGNQIKLIDFTTVRYKPNDDVSFFTTGTPGFRSPEHQFASSNGYSCRKSDIWSLGYCIYVFFYENMPFYGENDYEMDTKSLQDPLPFTKECPEVLVNLISKMTAKQQKERIDIDKVIELLAKHS